MTSSKVSREILQNNRDYNLIVTCYHEAGHIVAALRNFILPLECQVMKGNQIDANTTLKYFIIPKNSDAKLYRQLLMSRLHTYAAGIVAEEIFFNLIVGKSLPRNLRHGWHKDRIEFLSALKKTEKNPATRTRMREKIFKQTRQVLEKDWHIVIALAHALYDKKFLSFEDICRVVIRSDRPSAKYWRAFLKSFGKAMNAKIIPPYLMGSPSVSV